MKLKTFAFCALSSVLLTACQTTSVEEIQTSASANTIEEAKKALAPHRDFSVTENGIIHFTQGLPVGSRWSTAHIVEISYRISCENLRWFVDNGMVVRMQFKGTGGRTEDYDKNRCETEIPTDLYES